MGCFFASVPQTYCTLYVGGVFRLAGYRSSWELKKNMEEPSKMITIGHITPATFGRNQAEDVTVSLTDFGLILTLRADYAFTILEHSISKIFKRQKYSANVCTSFYLLRIFVYEK